MTFVFKHYICLRKRDDISKLSIHCTSVSGLCSILFEKSQERSNYLLDICKVMQDPFRRFTEEITPSRNELNVSNGAWVTHLDFPLSLTKDKDR